MQSTDSISKISCRLATFAALGLTILLQAGCANLSGYDAKSSFSCDAPEGVYCQSMTAVNARAKAGTLPGQQVNRRTGEAAPSADAGPPPETTGPMVMTQPLSSGAPIRTQAEVARIWINAWEDSDGDLNDQRYIYVTLNEGAWQVSHSRRRTQERFRSVAARAPETPSAAAPTSPVATVAPASTGGAGKQPAVREPAPAWKPGTNPLAGVITPANLPAAAKAAASASGAAQ